MKPISKDLKSEVFHLHCLQIGHLPLGAICVCSQVDRRFGLFFHPLATFSSFFVPSQDGRTCFCAQDGWTWPLALFHPRQTCQLSVHRTRHFQKRWCCHRRRVRVDSSSVQVEPHPHPDVAFGVMGNASLEAPRTAGLGIAGAAVDALLLGWFAAPPGGGGRRSSHNRHCVNPLPVPAPLLLPRRLRWPYCDSLPS